MKIKRKLWFLSCDGGEEEMGGIKYFVLECKNGKQ